MRAKAWRPNSIRARMTAGFALFIALLMLAVCATFFAYTKLADRRSADARLAAASTSIRQELDSGRYSLERPAELLAEEDDDLHAVNAVLLIVDRQNRVVARSQAEAPPWPMHGDSWRITTFESGAFRAVIGVRWHEIEVQLRARTLFLLGLSALVVALSSLGAWFLVGRTLSPIDHLARQANAASTDSLHVQLQAPSPDAEIVSLVATLNGLLARLGESAAARGRFYAAASHELRTPLQALTGHLEVALSRPRTAPDYKAALAEAHTQAERLTALVQDLLLLNQLDADTSRPPGVLLDLADMCVNELSPWRALIARHGLKVDLALPDTCEIVAPWNHATMLLRNLLENAIKYTPPGGHICVQLTGGRLILSNDCPVSGEAAGNGVDEKYFEPFFRPDASRNSQTGGNGLGLAICKAICTTNGWEITLHREPQQMRVVVVFGQ